MSLHPEVELVCDGAPSQFSCDWMPPIIYRTGVQARIFATNNGWLTAQPGGKDYCPKHRPDRQADDGMANARRVAEGP